MDTENVVVTKQDRKYKTLVTDIGKEKMTNAILNGKKVNVVMAAVGDGGNLIYVNRKKRLVAACASRFRPRAFDRIAFVREQMEPLFED